MKGGSADVRKLASALALSIAAMGVATQAHAASCADRLIGASVDRQLHCLEALRAAPDEAADAIASLQSFLVRSNGATDARLVGAALDVFRTLGQRASAAADTLSALLAHRSKLYAGRDKMMVVRLRAYLLLTLGDVGASSSALEATRETLANLDARMSAAEVGAAARVAGMLGPRGRELAPHLLDAIGQPFSDEEFSLERFDPAVPAEEATSVQREAVRALGRVCAPPDKDAIALLRTIADDRAVLPFDPRVVREARAALEGIHVARPADGPAVPPTAVGVWIAAGERKLADALDARVTDSTGRGATLGELVDRPLLVTFFYTRCQNAQKCSAALGRLAALQRQLAVLGLDSSVRLLAVTYEPQADTPDRIGRYAADRGLRLDGHALALRIDPARHQQVVDELQAPVNFNAGLVNTHGVELTLLDRRGRLVRKYTSVLWDNAAVIEDVRRLVAELH